jgi:subtilase family serine protease
MTIHHERRFPVPTRPLRRLVGAAVVLLLAGFLTTVTMAPATAATPARAACGTPAPGQARCLAMVHTGPQADALDGLPAGYGPDDLDAAYSLPVARGSGQTVAVVDAFDDPNVESDLATYRSTYGLPPCTVASGCLTKLNQEGVAGDYPPADGSWSLEISLDLDMVSASCPHCDIVLVEANSPFTNDLEAAENVATATGAIAVSNSWGANEFPDMAAEAAPFDHPGTTIVASSGDIGFTTAQFPAVLPTVLSVGGTTLTPDDSVRGFTETAWSGGSSGCSAYIAKPSWQADKHCHMRTVADVSSDGDPNTGVAVFDTVPFLAGQTWYVVGGTSAASPLIAGVVALSGQAVTPSFVYAHHGRLNDVVGGSNATFNQDCGGDYLCVAKKGYDAPTGWGTPDGAGAF